MSESNVKFTEAEARRFQKAASHPRRRGRQNIGKKKAQG